MRTYSPKEKEITREWRVIDAEGLVLGRVDLLAATIPAGSASP